MNMSDLAKAARVCHTWHRALTTHTPCLNLTLTDGALQRASSLVTVCYSALSKHISAIHFNGTDYVRPCELHMLASLSNLTAIHDCIVAQFDPATRFPTKLTTLDIIYVVVDSSQIDDHVQDIDSFFRCVATNAPQLTSIQLCFNFSMNHNQYTAISKQIDCTLLSRLKHLTDFSFKCRYFKVMTQPMIPSLVSFLRIHPTIQRVDLFVDTARPQQPLNQWLSPITAHPPVSLNYMNLNNTAVTSDNVYDLQKLTFLQTLNFDAIEVGSLQFMSAFPHCTHLRCETESIPIDTLVDDLKSLARLTSLTLSHDDLTSNHLTTILSYLPNLKHLTLFECKNITTLVWAGGVAGGAAAPHPAVEVSEAGCGAAAPLAGCGAAAPLAGCGATAPLAGCGAAAQLTHLSIIECRNIHSGSIDCLFNLKSLVALTFHNSFHMILDCYSRKMFQPPSLHLPCLKTFVCVPEWNASF